MSAQVLNSAEKDPFKIVFALNQLAAGRSNAIGTVTLASGQTSTTVRALNCAAGSAVFLFPQTSEAAAVVATTYVGAGDVAKEEFTVRHASAGADEAFWYLTIG